MESQDQDVAIACTLNDTEFRTRRSLARRTILPKLIKYQRIPDGLILVFSNSPKTRADVEDFIVLEQGCCGFLTFDLAPEPALPEDPLVLTITGPSNAASAIDLFAQTLETGINAQNT